MLLIYCLHGDELITEQVAKKFNKEYGIEIYLGNPTARAKKVRFVESDLNRSFGKTGTLEADRAQEIINEIGQLDEDLILDLHTTKAKMLPIAIITDLDQLKLVARTGLSKVIYMNKEFSTGGSLIENIPNSVSIEVHEDEEGKKVLEDAILNAMTNEVQIKEFEVYEVIEIVKGEKDLNLKNLEKLPDGTYPVFAGETSYKNVKYLKTKKYRVRP